MSTISFNSVGVDRTGAHEIWIYKLNRSYREICKELYGSYGNIDGKQLRMPQFRINQEHWGKWDPSLRTISLCEDLFLHFEWGAVEYILKHEMAHQIVSEIWDFDYRGHAHGEAFKRACKLLGISSDRCTSDTVLSDFHGDAELPVVDKVRKLLIKGNDGAVSESESEIFLRKAHEIMTRHSIDMRMVCGEDRFFISRPVGPLRKRWPSWEGFLSKMMVDYYGVRRIILYSGNGLQYMNLYGEPSNLDIAEYVYNAILYIGENLYRDFLAERKKKHDEALAKWRKAIESSQNLYFPHKPRCYHRASKAAFMEGLLTGYMHVLEEKHKDVVSQVSADYGKTESLLLLNDPMLKEAYHKEYPDIHMTTGNASYGYGRNAGFLAGQKMRIRTGISANSGNTRKMIGS